ncbi:hypothetical protein ACFRFH_08685 [Leifsonia sp. NPDC056824]|uniref:hypothetical protein n=1 Tax=Leifsonia sp. NPDC056824 TaxID=3345953 RepID=UPI00368B2287
MAALISVRRVEVFVTTLRNRMPFRYGIAEMTVLPHAFVRIEAVIDGRSVEGIAADNLPPKWFTKDPASSIEADLREFKTVLEAAVSAAEDAPAGTAFDTWYHVHHELTRWGAERALAPLLTSFAASLVERALIDAACRAASVPFHSAIRSGVLGFDVAQIHPGLTGSTAGSLLPAARRSLRVRHTVGFGDPLTDADIPEAERLDDGLPQSLEANLRGYGITYLKIKVAGNVAADAERLSRIHELTSTAVREGDVRFTLDGNEHFTDVPQFREYWGELTSAPALAGFFRQLLFLEQPLHRSVALSGTTAADLAAWEGRPEMIIDESDSALDSVSSGLSSGYIGASHKNCKGVFKGVANAMLLESRRRAGHRAVQSAEDLTNIGPVALLHDLAVVSSLGMSHVERNGHQYFRGLSGFPDDLQGAVQTAHGDLYAEHPGGFPTLRIRDGSIRLDTVVDAPFGVGIEPDALRVDRFTPLADWAVPEAVPSL